MIGIWLTISVWLDATCLWMSVIATVDIALIMRFSGINPGWLRFFGVLLGTVIIVLASLWLIAANAFGLVLGLYPLDAAQQVGSVLVWEFTRLRIGAVELIYPTATFLLAWYWAMRCPK